ncbi:MAG TPA: diacylglycerol kinase [Ruminococcus sp.]|nr:diacylglycerol kinase [Ruminococcus sp.]
MKTNSISSNMTSDFCGAKQKSCPIAKSRANSGLSSMKNKNIFQSMHCAFQGMKAAWKEERNFREYTAIYSVFFFLGLILGVSLTEFLIGFALVCGVFSAEYLNTALERLLDTKFPEISADNKFIKDTAAAGVFILSIAFFISQGLILIPKLLEVI